jgi:Tfp pilus assembly pilus retraction ATPase PilT
MVPNLGRFRVNAFMQRQQIGMVLRVIPTEVKSIQDLSLPPVLEKIAMEHRGMVLVTGATGSGKSTTLAALINHINAQRTAHVVTIEGPGRVPVPRQAQHHQPARNRTGHPDVRAGAARFTPPGSRRDPRR